MREYLIRRTDGEWFDLTTRSLEEVLRPGNRRSERVEGWGDLRIKVDGYEIAFSYEDPGIQVVMEGDPPTDLADQILDEILLNIERLTRQKGQVVPL